mmetsp:Transcript_28223/g.47972  ORF Transcript_28223/g.47972 Transcript_28223/m.47972 type:complete len:97 (-) Transcript_28223:488-778(-)
MWRTIKGGKNNGVVGKNHSQNQCDGADYLSMRTLSRRMCCNKDGWELMGTAQQKVKVTSAPGTYIQHRARARECELSLSATILANEKGTRRRQQQN